MKRPLIFVCHSSVDKPFVRGLVARLRNDGVDCWLDELEIHVGESIHRKINDALAKSDFFAVVLSESSVKSRWVQDELASASSLEKYKERGIFILPILLEECDIPPLLLDRRYANFKDDQESAYQELIDSIRHHFGAGYPDVDVSGIAVSELTHEVVLLARSQPQILKKLAPRHFEELIADLMRKSRYEVTLTAASRDGGYDIIAQGPLVVPDISPPMTLVQCKRYNRPIGVAEVRALAGAQMIAGAEQAMLVTTSSFTSGAVETAKKLGIQLVDATGIAKWIRRIWPSPLAD